jgi:hypothetical protein
MTYLQLNSLTSTLLTIYTSLLHCEPVTPYFTQYQWQHSCNQTAKLLTLSTTTAGRLLWDSENILPSSVQLLTQIWERKDGHWLWPNLENVHGLDWSRPLEVQWWNHSHYLVWPRKASKIWVQIMKCCNHPKRPVSTVNCALPIYQLNKSSGRTGNLLQTILDV